MSLKFRDSKLTLLAVSQMYVFFCTFYSLFRMGVISLYFLVPGRSDTFSLFYNAMFMSRFAPAMSYNFLRMAKVDHGYCFKDGDLDADDPDVHTSFHNLFGASLDLVPFFGKGFQRYFPSIIVFYCLSLAFRLTDRILAICFRSSRVQLDPDSLAEDGMELEHGDNILRQIRENVERGDDALKGAPFGASTVEDGSSKGMAACSRSILSSLNVRIIFVVMESIGKRTPQTRPPTRSSIPETRRGQSSRGAKPSAKNFDSLKDRLANARQAISEGRRPTYTLVSHLPPTIIDISFPVVRWRVSRLLSIQCLNSCERRLQMPQQNLIQSLAISSQANVRLMP